MFHISLLTILLGCNILGIGVSASEKRCIPLSRCQEVKWIVEAQPRLSMNTNELLSQVGCGFNAATMEPKVWCNVGTIEESTHYGIFDMSEQLQCIGQLKIYTAMNNALQIYKLRTGRLYRNLNGLKNIYRITADGTCCWKVHPRRSLRGLGRQISFGYDDIPPFKIISVKSTSC